jgi:hypothetical protein
MRIPYDFVCKKEHLSFQNMFQPAMEWAFDETSFGIAMDLMSPNRDLEYTIVFDKPLSSIAQVVFYFLFMELQTRTYFQDRGQVCFLRKTTDNVFIVWESPKS